MHQAYFMVSQSPTPFFSFSSFFLLLKEKKYWHYLDLRRNGRVQQPGPVFTSVGMTRGQRAMRFVVVISHVAVATFSDILNCFGYFDWPVF